MSPHVMLLYRMVQGNPISSASGRRRKSHRNSRAFRCRAFAGHILPSFAREHKDFGKSRPEGRDRPGARVSTILRYRALPGTAVDRVFRQA